MPATRLTIWLLMVLAVSTGRLHGAEIIQLTAENYDQLCPKGKEVDAIYGDYLMRNDVVVAVIAQPTAWRNANMTVRDVAAAVIDLTLVDEQNDQLSAFYPDARQFEYREVEVVKAKGEQVAIRFTSPATPERPSATLIYTMADGEAWIQVVTVYHNETDKQLSGHLRDEVRADNTFTKVADGPCKYWWADDIYWRQAYGVFAPERKMTSQNNGRVSQISYLDGDDDIAELASKAKLRHVRAIRPASNRTMLRALPVSPDADPEQATLRKLLVVVSEDAAGDWIHVGAKDDPNHAVVRTDERGNALLMIDDSTKKLTLDSMGRGEPIDIDVPPRPPGPFNLEVLPVVGLREPSYVQAKITDGEGNPIACKVEFIGRDGTPSPDFGHESEAYTIKNLCYTPNGQLSQRLNPGKYDVIVSHGIEYDAYFGQIEVTAEKTTPLEVKLNRSVDTQGWISTDFHSHASPSGDNTASQLGRVLNLLAEHIEYAPCTEHNRIDTYLPHFETLQVNGRMATASGMELTGSPLPLNHQNAFPLVMKKGEQDQGGPLSDNDPVAQVSRLALWDSRSEKLVQQNHPDLGWMYADVDGNFIPDEGFLGMIQFQDVVEIHMTHRLLKMEPFFEYSGKQENNVAFNWLQFLNQGIRTPAVHNTDAHYNYHGSGGIRNYIRSNTDNPAEIQTIDVVHDSEAGHIVLTNGPFLEVRGIVGKKEVLPGDDVAAPDGGLKLHVRVQCANWLDIDRVQVLVNGRAQEELNFTRAKNPDGFQDGVVKFEREIPVQLAKDAHVIVVAVHETKTVGAVMGPEWGKELIGACANPIYVDVDGNGWQPNGDTLDHPLPVKGGKAK